MEECDLVMKGGVTSGAVYPKAISRLAKDYRFRSIGGTSAGAIAAAAAAAAEYQRQTSPSKNSLNGFAVLERLPNRLGEPGSKGTGSTLLELFQPQSEFRPLFWFLLAFVGKDRTEAGTSKPHGYLLDGCAVRRFANSGRGHLEESSALLSSFGCSDFRSVRLGAT